MAIKTFPALVYGKPLSRRACKVSIIASSVTDGNSPIFATGTTGTSAVSEVGDWSLQLAPVLEVEQPGGLFLDGLIVDALARPSVLLVPVVVHQPVGSPLWRRSGN